MHAALGEEPIERIAVFRALMLGDLLCAVPALRALRAGFPAATITWIGLGATRAMAGRLDHLIDDYLVLPGYPGLPEVPVDAAALPAFFAGARSRRFDLALQMHGSGSVVNPLVAALGARHTAGFFDARAPVPRRDAPLYRPWPEGGHEILRMLALTDHLGIARQGTELEFPLRRADHDALACVWPASARPERYVCLHAGAQLASRRWPLDRFALLAEAVAASGRTVVLTGAAGELGLAAELVRRLRCPVVNLVGQTTLGSLGVLIQGAEALVCNDTSVSHIAAALGCASVVVSCGADVARWAPLDEARHRVLWEPMACRPCAHASCPTGHACAAAITPGRVLAELRLPAPQRPKARFVAALARP